MNTIMIRKEHHNGLSFFLSFFESISTQETAPISQVSFRKWYWSVLQRVAVCYGVLQCVAVCCRWLILQVFFRKRCYSVLQRVAACCRVLPCVAMCCSVFQMAYFAGLFPLMMLHCNCSVLQCVAVCCNVLQCFAVCCSTSQCVAVCCSLLRCGVDGLFSVNLWGGYD